MVKVMNGMNAVRSNCVALGAIAAVLLSCTALAHEATDNLLKRAVVGGKPTSQDIGLAKELLADWEDSGPDDAYLRPAFERIAAGLPPLPDQMPAMRKLRTTFLETRRKAMAARYGGAGESDGRAGGAASSRRGMLGRGRSWKHAVMIVGLGVGVVAAGLVFLVVKRRRRRG
jgi:hypothetical protein